MLLRPGVALFAPCALVGRGGLGAGDLLTRMGPYRVGGVGIGLLHVQAIYLGHAGLERLGLLAAGFVVVDAAVGVVQGLEAGVAGLLDEHDCQLAQVALRQAAVGTRQAQASRLIQRRSKAMHQGQLRCLQRLQCGCQLVALQYQAGLLGCLPLRQGIAPCLQRLHKLSKFFLRSALGHGRQQRSQARWRFRRIPIGAGGGRRQVRA